MLRQEQIEKQVAIFLRGPYEMTIRQALLTGATWAANKQNPVIEQLQAENERLREAIQRIGEIASMGDVNIQPLLVPVIDIAKKAL